jgi:hypothetical protein
MPQTYNEGDRLKGSDGNTYVVHGGQPVLESSVNNAPSVRTYGTPKPGFNNEQPISDAELRAKTLANQKAQQEIDDEAAARAALAIQPNSKVHGEQYIQTLPGNAQGIVRSLIQGNLPVGTRGISSKELLPYVQMAVNADPSFSAANFPARQEAAKQLADAKSTGGYLASLGANIDHSHEEEAAITGLGNPGGLAGRLGGAALNNLIFNANSPAGARFAQANRVYGGEAAKSITGSIGSAGGNTTQGDRVASENAITASQPIDTQRATLQTAAIQNYQKYMAANDTYRRTMGADIPDPFRPDQAAQMLHLMRLQGDGTEGPLPDGLKLTPSFLALAAKGGANIPGGPSGGAPGAPPPPAFGGPGTPPSGPTGLTAALQGGQYGDASTASIDGQTKSVPNTVYLQALNGFNKLVAAGASPDKLKAYSDEFHLDNSAALDYLAKNPGFKGPFPPNTDQANVQIPLSPTESLVNTIGGSPAGTMFGNATNSLLANLPRAAATAFSPTPDKTNAVFAASDAQNPGAATLGSLAGGAGGAMLGEGIAAKGLSALPWVARGLEGADKAAAIAPYAARGGDALYGAISGGTTDPTNPLAGAVEGAGLGMGGGMLGRGATSGLGKVLTGVQGGPVGILKDAGVPLTLGQAVSQSGAVGSGVKKLEDALTSVPLVGDMLQYTRNRGIKGFNQAAFDEALAPVSPFVGAAKTGLKEQGIDNALGHVGNAYDAALNGKSFTLPMTDDSPFVQAAMAGAKARTGGGEFQDIVDRNIAPLIGPDGQVSGQNFQGLSRTTRDYAGKYSTIANGTPGMSPPQPGYEPISDAFSGMNSALRDTVGAQDPSVLPAYDAAGDAWRNTKVLQDAVNRARNGTRSGDPGVFMPSQLADAAAANSRVFGGTQGTTNQPFFSLSRAGQDVLPSSVPDSGTARRALVGLGTLGSLGAATGSGNDTAADVSGGALGALGTMTLLASPAGQRAMRAMVLKRPDVAQWLGQGIQSAAPYGGLFGASVLPTAISQQQ